MSKNIVGQTYENRNGYEYTVIGYNEANNRYTVLFHHNGAIKTRSKFSIASGSVSEKPEFTTPKEPQGVREAKRFNAMHHRVATDPAYADVTIDPRWETLEGFRSTIHMVKNYDLFVQYDGYDLDKDESKQRMYGPDTCKFIPRSENASKPRKSVERKHYPIGSRLQNRYGQWYTVIAKDQIWSTIQYDETGEVRKITTHTISKNKVGKSKGE